MLLVWLVTTLALIATALATSRASAGTAPVRVHLVPALPPHPQTARPFPLTNCPGASPLSRVAPGPGAGSLGLSAAEGGLVTGYLRGPFGEPLIPGQRGRAPDVHALALRPEQDQQLGGSAPSLPEPVRDDGVEPAASRLHDEVGARRAERLPGQSTYIHWSPS